LLQIQTQGLPLFDTSKGTADPIPLKLLSSNNAPAEYFEKADMVFVSSSPFKRQKVICTEKNYHSNTQKNIYRIEKETKAVPQPDQVHTLNL